MYPSQFNNPPPGSVLSTDYLNPDFWFEKIVAFFSLLFRSETGNLLGTLATLLSLFFISVMGYCAVRLFEIRRKEHHHLEHEIREYAHKQAAKERQAVEEQSTSKNPAWVKVVEHVYSGNPAEWKLAIIEADAMLDRLMTELGFRGETLGDKLKSATQDTFKNLSAAWEAHAVRNRIAHESNFEISLHETKRITALYEQVFRTYGYI